MAATGEIVVFTDTNLDTHLAMAVYPDTTSGDFKRKLRRTHLDCFPELGEIKVYGLMVKRKSHFYSLPDSMLLRHAFQGFKGSWFLRVEASIVNGSMSVALSNCANAEAQAPPREPQATCPSPERKKKKTIKFKRLKREEILYATSNKDFGFPQSRNEVESIANRNSRKQNDVCPKFMVRTLPRKHSCPSPAERSAATKKLPRTVVGKRLLTASDNIRASAYKRSPALSLSRFRARKYLRQNASSFANYLVFELSNDSH